MQKPTPKQEMAAIEKKSREAHKDTLKKTLTVESQVAEQRERIAAAEQEEINRQERARGRI